MIYSMETSSTPTREEISFSAAQSSFDSSVTETGVSETAECPEVGTSALDGTNGPLHGAEDPRDFRLERLDDYIEPESRARSVEPFRHPAETVESVNPNYEMGPEYQNNCADCARVFEATWRGRQQEAAGLVDYSQGGELPSVTEEWAHEDFRPVTPAELRTALETGGHGSSAVPVTYYESPDRSGGHAYNVINYHGEIITVDSQSGRHFEFSDQAIHKHFEADDTTHFAMGWDAKGRRII